MTMKRETQYLEDRDGGAGLKILVEYSSVSHFGAFSVEIRGCNFHMVLHYLSCLFHSNR